MILLLETLSLPNHQFLHFLALKTLRRGVTLSSDDRNLVVKSTASAISGYLVSVQWISDTGLDLYSVVLLLLTTQSTLDHKPPYNAYLKNFIFLTSTASLESSGNLTGVSGLRGGGNTRGKPGYFHHRCVSGNRWLNG